VIKTIRDLDTASDEEIEKARKSVNFKGLVFSQLKEDGEKPGMTLDEWQEFVDNREPHECPACHGEGEILPRVRTVGTIHASSSSKCVAALYYDVTGELAPKESLSPELQFTFAIGHAIHDLVQKALHRAMGEDFEDEVRVDLPEALIINGSADGRAYFPRCRVLLEIKTISEKEFGKLRKPKSEHLTQAAGLYAKGLDVPFISFLYISKGWPHDMKEYVLVYDDAVFRKWYREKGIKVENALEERRPPKADASPYECKNCSYGYGCPQRLGNKSAFRRT
jgi:CRISPR/Cas system-associated exonuclease Cas4 (RecB family)